MKISTRGRYGLRAMIDLSMHSDGTYVSLASIAERQCLSLGYLEGIFSSLKKVELVVGSAGSQGGYLPALPPEQITMRAILGALEGSMSLTDGADVSATRLRSFLTRAVWDRADSAVAALLDEITVADMIREFESRDQAVDSSGL